ncbi:MAG: hypothetical protein OXG27_12835 [Chloroflexi bacterium]|nr:hypothetical protein [Chloroflexota bacterium]
MVVDVEQTEADGNAEREDASALLERMNTNPAAFGTVPAYATLDFVGPLHAPGLVAEDECRRRNAI